MILVLQYGENGIEVGNWFVLAFGIRHRCVVGNGAYIGRLRRSRLYNTKMRLKIEGLFDEPGNVSPQTKERHIRDSL